MTTSLATVKKALSIVIIYQFLTGNTQMTTQIMNKMETTGKNKKTEKLYYHNNDEKLNGHFGTAYHNDDSEMITKRT